MAASDGNGQLRYSTPFAKMAAAISAVPHVPVGVPGQAVAGPVQRSGAPRPLCAGLQVADVDGLIGSNRVGQPPVVRDQ
jgi:hypothetical protein